jgi:hypothetical protein
LEDDRIINVLDPAESLIASIASHGLLGVLLVLSMYVAYSKDKQLQEEREARIADAKNYTNLALELQAQVIEAVNKLTDTFEEMKKIMVPSSRTVGGGR